MNSMLFPRWSGPLGVRAEETGVLNLRLALPWQVFDTLYGKKAAALYTQAGDYQKTARFYYKKAEDTYYQANNWAAYDDWRRARDQWDYFYSRE